MIKSVNVNYEAFGAEFANAGDKDQALFFKGIANELKYWNSDHLKRMQSAAISTLLTGEEKNQLTMFLSCITNE